MRRRKPTIPFTDADLIPRPPNDHPQPFNTVVEMCVAFEVLATNKTPAVNGSQLSPLANTSNTPPRHRPEHNRRARVAPALTPKVHPSTPW